MLIWRIISDVLLLLLLLLICSGIVGESWVPVGIRPRSCMPGPGMLLQPNYLKVLPLLFTVPPLLSVSKQPV